MSLEETNLVDAPMTANVTTDPFGGVRVLSLPDPETIRSTSKATTESFWSVVTWGRIVAIYDSREAAEADRLARIQEDEESYGKVDAASIVVSPLAYETTPPKLYHIWRIHSAEQVVRSTQLGTYEGWVDGLAKRHYYASEEDARADIPAELARREATERVYEEFNAAMDALMEKRAAKLDAVQKFI